MKNTKIKQLVTEAVLSVMNEVSWEDVEGKIGKWFKLSPGLAGNIKSVDVQSAAGLRKSVVLHDKRGNNVILVKDAPHDFTDRYMPVLANLLSAISGQQVKKSDKEHILFI